MPATRPLKDGECYRCTGCGNLTRFDVSLARRTKEFWHFDMSGEFKVETVEVVSEVVESVVCGWCTTGKVEVIDRDSKLPVD